MLIMRRHVDRIASLVETLGTPAFGPQFYTLFNDLFSIKQCVAFTFSREGERSSLFAEGCDERHRRTANDLAFEYVRWAFKRDQNVHPVPLTPHVGRSEVGIYTCAARDLKDADYRRQFYDEPELRGKLVMQADIGETCFYVNFYRGRGEAPFTWREIDIARGMAALSLQALVRHHQMSSLDRTHRVTPSPQATLQCRPMREQVRDVFLDLRSGLTHRESEICAGIVIGETAEELSASLSISVHTVATHRKRAYAKLGVTSQGGLFAQYLRYSGHSHGAYAAAS